MAIFSSCSSAPPKTAPVVRTFREEGGGSGFGGQVVVNSVRTNAIVISVDAIHRQLVLRLASGSQVTYRAGNEVSNFDQIRPGDKVKTTTVEEFAVSIDSSDTLANSTNRVTVMRTRGRIGHEACDHCAVDRQDPFI